VSGRAAQSGTEDFNARAWAELSDVLGRSGLAQIAEVMARDVWAQTQLHDTAAAADDLPALKRVVHSLSGACLQLGAEALADLCGQAEAACLANDRESALRLGAEAMGRYRALVERLVRETRTASG
jgi:HPt (histidine-containing phosphotransfer) domain-containing protein